MMLGIPEKAPLELAAHDSPVPGAKFLILNLTVE